MTDFSPEADKGVPQSQSFQLKLGEPLEFIESGVEIRLLGGFFNYGVSLQEYMANPAMDGFLGEELGTWKEKFKALVYKVKAMHEDDEDFPDPSQALKMGTDLLKLRRQPFFEEFRAFITINGKQRMVKIDEPFPINGMTEDEQEITLVARVKDIRCTNPWVEMDEWSVLGVDLVIQEELNDVEKEMM